MSTDFAVFPSTEACLIEARRGAFAGCISATANLNADLCARAWSNGDAAALEAAVTIRKLFDGKPLVSGVKALLAHIHGDAGAGSCQTAAGAFSAADRAAVIAGHDAVRAKRVGHEGPLQALTPTQGLTISLSRARRVRPPPQFLYKPVALAEGPLEAPAANERLMANTKSARKATRVIARRTEVNKARRSVLRNSVRKVEEAIRAAIARRP